VRHAKRTTAGRPRRRCIRRCNPFQQRLPASVSPLHELYYEQSGNPRRQARGVPARRPGAVRPILRTAFFDPKRYLIVLFDQRGCGKSRPHAELRENTTWDLTADIETLREHLGDSISGWCLAARGAQRWRSPTPSSIPARVSELVLRGIFLLRQSEIDWLYQNPQGAARLFPDSLGRLRSAHPQARARRYGQRLLPPPDLQECHGARRGGTRLVDLGRRHQPPADEPIRATSRNSRIPTVAAAFARIECHYFINKRLPQADDQLLRDVRASGTSRP
jgi:proline iminopeptidase